MSISTGLYPNLDLWTANKLQLQLQLLECADNKITWLDCTLRAVHVAVCIDI
jgi:hypothetical protein